MNSDLEDPTVLLRASMVNELRDLDGVVSEAVAEAFARVPRHLFAPGEPLKEVYAADKALVVKSGPDGRATSSLSAAHIQAVMLEQAAIEPGMRVLEVGSGGYNSALVQELVGADGAVVSVDIDQEIVERARDCLDSAGYEQVTVVWGDAENGVAEAAPFDRIIVTAGAWDLPPAWLDQLTEGGRIVVPLRMRGLTRSVAFDRDGPGLVSASYRLCGFVPMQGSGAFSERVVPITDDVALRLDDDTRTFDIEALGAAFDSPRLERWSGAAFDLPDELELFLVTSDQRMVMLHASDDVVERGVLAASATRGVPALVDGGSFAYRMKRPNEQAGGFESGVLAHGPDAEQVADDYVDLLRRWAADHRRRGAARLHYLPTTTASTDLSPGLIAKKHGSLTVSWS